MKKYEKWLSFFWTFAWLTALIVLCVYNVYALLSNNSLNSKSLVVAVVSGGYVILLIKPCIKKAKMIRNDGISDETVMNLSENAPRERNFFKLYERICNQRIACVVLCTLLFEVPLFLMFLYGYPNYHLREGWIIEHVFYAMIPLIPSLVLICKVLVAKKRNLQLLERVYSTSNFDEIKKIDSMARGKSFYIFTKKYFFNWDSNLNIVALKDIECIRYVPYFYLFWYGTKLVIREYSGKKHTIWFYGPESAVWEPMFMFPQKNGNDSIRAKVENNINF